MKTIMPFDGYVVYQYSHTSHTFKIVAILSMDCDCVETLKPIIKEILDMNTRAKNRAKIFYHKQGDNLSVELSAIVP
jgi:hypothetical protein